MDLSELVSAGYCLLFGTGKAGGQRWAEQESRSNSIPVLRTCLDWKRVRSMLVEWCGAMPKVTALEREMWSSEGRGLEDGCNGWNAGAENGLEGEDVIGGRLSRRRETVGYFPMGKLKRLM